MSLKSDVTMATLLKKAPLLLLGRLEILLLLSILFGIIAGVVTFPVIQALQPIVTTPDEVDVAEIMGNIGDQLPITLLISLLINSALLIPITRLLVDSEPFEGGFKKFFTRFSRIFALQITAVALFLVFIFTLSIILGILSAILPQALILIIAIAAGIGSLLVIYTVTNVAIVGEAIDSRTSLIIAWHMIRPLLVPLAGAYAVIKVAAMLLSAITTGIIGALLAGFDLPWLPTMIDQSFGFAAQIVHFSACLWATQAIMKQRKNGANQS